MSELDVASSLMQFGAAGLIALMWLTERRAAAGREAQLRESHERLMEQRVQLDAMLRLVGENTRAITSLESSQRRLATLLERLVRKRDGLARPSDAA